MQFSIGLANQIKDKILYAKSVSCDENMKFMDTIDAVYFDIDDNYPAEIPSKPIVLSRTDILWLLDNDYRIFIPPSNLKTPIFEIIQYVNQKDGKTYLTTRLAETPSDNLYPLGHS
jgi:hypothetical protein